jgi:hypothetical protein
MNVIIYDAPPGITRFIASLIRAAGHRVSATADAEDAKLRISTTLFDAIVLGPSGAPRELADFIEAEFSHLPVVLAGVPVEIPAAGQVAAVLPAPLSAERLASTLRRLDFRRRERLSKLPVALDGEGVSISCRMADLAENTMVLAGESDEFQRYFGTGPRRVKISVLGVPVDGEVARADRGELLRVRRVDVRLEPASARELFSLLRKEPAVIPA